MQILIIVGSHRRESQSSRVGRYVGQDLRRIASDVVVETLDLAGNPLPLWDESLWEAGSSLAGTWKPIRDRLRAADGFVIVSPEWAGMAPPALKNLLLFAGQKEVGHKPALLVTLSASRGGSYPVSELRMSGGKNNRLLLIPEQVVIHDVADMLAAPEPAGERDAWLRRRLEFAERILLEYTRAIGPIRASGLTEDPDFPYGM